MDKFVEYAPIILVVMGFLISYRIFVTPKQLNDTLNILKAEFEKTFVRKDVNDITLEQIKEDTSETKDKVNMIYQALIKKVEL